VENTTETQDHMTQVSFRIPKSLKDLVEKFVAQDCHVNASDFFREALREKIKNEAPELYAQLFKETKLEASQQ
jgi:Arc/MetJ-type ribon-helix-helix transcriptional regulator